MTEKRNLLSRRDWLKLVGAAGAGALALGAPETTFASGAGDTANAAAMLLDATRCVGCKACEVACKEWNDLPPENEPPTDTTAYTWTLIKQYQEGIMQSFRKVQCLHCLHPACVSVCTVGALRKTEKGPVVYDAGKCIGCRYCVVACPYGSRSFNWKDPRKAPNLAELENTYPTRMRGVVEKCTFCDERLARGEQPACVEACDNDEMVFGDLNDPGSKVRRLLAEHMTIRRKPGLGTQPEVYYIVEDPRTLQEFAPAAEVFEEEGGHA